MNIAEKFKEQTDKILRQQRVSPSAGMIVRVDQNGNPNVTKPFTSEEVNTMIAAVYYEPLTNGDPSNPEFIFNNDGDILMVEV